mgnify:FL=1
MQFSKHIPETAMQSPNTWKFIQVLQGAYDWKKEVIGASLRCYNAAVLTNKHRLIDMLRDLGFNLPYITPLWSLQQLLLNAETLLSARGSLVGLEILLSILVLGKSEIDISKFFAPLKIVIPDSRSNGFVLDNTADRELFLISDNQQLINTSKIVIEVATPLLDEPFWDDYAPTIKRMVRGFIPFGDTEVVINYTKSTDKFIHRKLNRRFV